MTLEAYIAFCLAASPSSSCRDRRSQSSSPTAQYGPRAGLLNVAGTQAGLLVWMAVAVLGLASAIKFMGFWFDVLRFAGAAYLVWLGIKLMRSKGELLPPSAQAQRRLFPPGLRRHPVQPKVLLVFGALIPQFISPKGDYINQLCSSGVTFMVVATIFEASMLLPPASRLLAVQEPGALVEVSSGMCLIGGGVWLALRGR